MRIALARSRSMRMRAPSRAIFAHAHPRRKTRPRLSLRHAHTRRRRPRDQSAERRAAAAERGGARGSASADRVRGFRRFGGARRGRKAPSVEATEILRNLDVATAPMRPCGRIRPGCRSAENAQSFRRPARRSHAIWAPHPAVPSTWIARRNGRFSRSPRLARRSRTESSPTVIRSDLSGRSRSFGA